MKREIKFRIWDNVMHRWWCEDSQYLQMDGTKIHAAPWSTLEASLSEDRVCVEQFMNFKDRNDKDVYEGDILKSSNEYLLNGEFPYLVEYEPFLYWIQESDLREEYHRSTIEIIGNIHETPELLEKL